MYPVHTAVIALAAVLVGPLPGCDAPASGESARATAAAPKPAQRVILSNQGERTSAADLVDAPAGEQGSAIRRGKAIAERTRELVPGHVGNALRCTSCHLGGGATPRAASWVGVTRRYPQYRARSGKVDTLEERVNDCFERSMNGAALDVAGREMKDLVAYMDYLSRGAPVDGSVPGASIPLVQLARPPDIARGQQVWSARCHTCHGRSGEGVRALDGTIVLPPVAGDASFNVGAGMARVRTAAGFIRHNMPLGLAGTLSEADAWDVAGYLTALPRPDFAKKHLDWPQGEKPPDARY